MALVRIILGLGAVVLFMPTDKETQAKVYDATANAVDRVATFCIRNPETCQKGGEYWAVFKQKAEFGAKMAWTLAVDRMNRGDAKTAADPDNPKSPAIPVRQQGVRNDVITSSTTSDRGTLKPQDLEPAWRPASHSIRRGT